MSFFETIDPTELHLTIKIMLNKWELKPITQKGQFYKREALLRIIIYIFCIAVKPIISVHFHFAASGGNWHIRKMTEVAFLIIK